MIRPRTVPRPLTLPPPPTVPRPCTVPRPLNRCARSCSQHRTTSCSQTHPSPAREVGKARLSLGLGLSLCAGLSLSLGLGLSLCAGLSLSLSLSLSAGRSHSRGPARWRSAARG